MLPLLQLLHKEQTLLLLSAALVNVMLCSLIFKQVVASIISLQTELQFYNFDLGVNFATQCSIAGLRVSTTADGRYA